MNSPNGIAGLEGREPVGAALVVPFGGKFEYQIMEARPGLQTQHGERREPHPAFRKFNELPPERRTSVVAAIEHARLKECFEHHLTNQVGRSGQHPNRRPFCVGNGRVAVRWMGDKPANFETQREGGKTRKVYVGGAEEADNFSEIECPNERCEFRLSDEKKPAACRPWMRLYFRLSWKEGSEMPSLPCVFTSRSWNTVANFYGERAADGRVVRSGLFGRLLDVANQLGIENPLLFGYPFVLHVAKRTKASEQTRFPVTTPSPMMDAVDFFRSQSQRLEEIGARPKMVALTDASAQDPGVVAQGLDAISVPAVPGC